jgi:peptidoglycan-associated lipoprotein
MKKVLVVFLMFFIIGCAKKYVKAPEEPVKEEEPAVEETLKPEKEKVEEVVEEKILPKEEEVVKEEVIEPEPQLVAKAEVEIEKVLKDIHFDFDKYDIRPDARPILDSIASWLRENEEVNIIIEGHCDERGTNEYNLALGEKRAKATRDYLVSLGVSPKRMSLITYGEEKPLCTEKNEACWQKNRRAHFVIAE